MCSRVWFVSHVPHTKKIRLRIFGYPDYPILLDSLLSDEESVLMYNRISSPPCGVACQKVVCIRKWCVF